MSQCPSGNICYIGQVFELRNHWQALFHQCGRFQSGHRQFVTPSLTHRPSTLDIDVNGLIQKMPSLRPVDITLRCFRTEGSTDYTEQTDQVRV